MSPFLEVPNWFPKLKGTIIESLFYNLASKFNDEFIKRIIKKTIHWYVETLNTSFIENQTINSQIALEKLFFVYLLNKTLKSLVKQSSIKIIFKI